MGPVIFASIKYYVLQSENCDVCLQIDAGLQSLASAWLKFVLKRYYQDYYKGTTCGGGWGLQVRILQKNSIPVKIFAKGPYNFPKHCVVF